MIYLKIKQPLHSLVLLFCLAYAFDSPSDSQQSLGLSKNVPTFSESGQARSHPELSGGLGSNRGSSNSLTDAESIQSQSSELSDLFAVGTSNALGETSSVTSVTRSTSKAFLTKAEPLKPTVSDATSPRSGGPSFKLNPSSSKPLVVPSEGGLMQDSSSVTTTETKIGVVKDDSSASSRAESQQEKESETKSSTEGSTLIDEGDIPVVKKQLKPQDSHISARKGANLSEKSEPTSSNINDTAVQFTFPSSELPFTKEVRPQKIAPRKGVEPPKIFPRKGVEDKTDNSNSSDSFFSEENNDSGPTSTATTNSTPLVKSPMSKTTPLYTSDLPDSVKGVISNIANPFQNSSQPDFSMKASTPSVSSKSSVIRPILETSTLRFENLNDTGVKNSKFYSNVTALTDVKNDTEDKSGIIASYPKLKKRLKPLKTTDTNTLNSSPTPPEHTSSEHDYIVPIVVTILTIPMLVVLVLFLYKKGSEFWERRHYRRMDFLIDGMYND